MKISVCVTTYNNVVDLSRAIDAYEKQSRLPDEILICDDGSGPGIVREISRLISKSKIPMRHIWHEDCGWRLAAIRNLGILAAKGDFLIFADGDCLPRKDFVQDYERFANKGEMIIGGKVHVKRPYRDRFIPKGVVDRVFWAACNRLVNRSYIFPKPWETGDLYSKAEKPSREFIEGIGLGCNHGFWRDDALSVGGCEESFTSWGPEDADFVFRLMNIGIRVRQFYSHCQVFHLDHPMSERVFSLDVDKLVLQSYEGARIWPSYSCIRDGGA